LLAHVAAELVKVIGSAHDEAGASGINRTGTIQYLILSMVPPTVLLFHARYATDMLARSSCASAARLTAIRLIGQEVYQAGV
jgi:hypothetical protein